MPPADPPAKPSGKFAGNVRIPASHRATFCGRKNRLRIEAAPDPLWSHFRRTSRRCLRLRDCQTVPAFVECPHGAELAPQVSVKQGLHPLVAVARRCLGRLAPASAFSPATLSEYPHRDLLALALPEVPLAAPPLA